MESNQPSIFFAWQMRVQNGYKKIVKKAVESLGYKYLEATNDRIGSIDIVESIFKRISDCDVFIADITPIDELNGEHVLDPNVLIEYGFALKKLEYKERILLLTNTTKGKYPFDLSHNRMTKLITKDSNENIIKRIAGYIKQSYEFRCLNFIDVFDKLFDTDLLIILNNCVKSTNFIEIMKNISSCMVYIPVGISDMSYRLLKQLVPEDCTVTLPNQICKHDGIIITNKKGDGTFIEKDSPISYSYIIELKHTCILFSLAGGDTIVLQDDEDSE